ncbi:hypothetical protein DVH07_18390 [Hafnia paralvei]|uniref:hypothetical protein n=1 Tax=Hafnia paralvei TaxID=546367 RepID=UPI000DF3082C|nr:hypothetical protein [Hafnia paralvei]RDA61918.1 hypothetical protein DU449_17950 [Hafnia paralvei]RDA62978.1 hypothetical protein DVH08_20160 [Hafnia paralvei]RDA63818.1 hypothetical protein DVH09_18520 [Hafnia paralvei]RDA75104.1 hypothetical protein DVH10_17690 [Hafnia paralvei]RDA75509.1 hypothetical protein DVH07_18390 [Hafnia paralvei]
MNPKMTKQQASVPVIVYAHSWPEARALEAYIAEYYDTPDAVRVCERVSTLLQVLQLTPKSPLILALNPHEYVNLLYALWPWLGNRRILFVGQSFNYTDRQIPSFFISQQVTFYCWLQASEPSMKAQSGLLHFLHHTQESDLLPDAPYLSAVQRFECEAELLMAINRYLLNRMFIHGVTAKEYEVILELLKPHGTSVQVMKRTRQMHPKTLSAHKLSALKKLGMSYHPVSVWSGLQVKAELQQKRFTPTICDEEQQSLPPILRTG